LVVATANGYVQVPEAYTYASGVFSPDDTDNPVSSDFYADQEHYVQVTNLYRSCYGGLGSGINGCENTNFGGQVGVGGEAEFFRFAYPRLHTTSVGWLTSFDAAFGSWRVADPDPVFPSGVEDLRLRLPQGLKLRNPAFSENVCVDLSSPLVQSPVDCDGSLAQRVYNLGEMQWCEAQDPAEGGLYSYQPDWPVNHDFFQPKDQGEPTEIRIDIPDGEDLRFGVNDVPLFLPEYLQTDAEIGFENTTSPGWAIGSMTACTDEDGDGETTLDENGIVLSWSPAATPDLGGAEAINSYLHVSFTSVDFTWYGLETIGVRASTVVPDAWSVDDEGRSRLEIPNSILYQLPTPNGSWNGNPNDQNPSTPGRLGRYSDNPRYLFMEVYRITDYRIGTEQGDMVFSYATGEITILGDWSNPATRTRDCDDCIDGDNDGWTDDLDPDCNRAVGGNGSTENNRTSAFTCNDGVDNNANGLRDSQDPLCDNGWDGETTCGDSLDNDGDGWNDAVDPDCGGGPFDQEDGETFGGTCNDGIDNDGDGWVDSGDLGCTSALVDENDGFTGSVCNDGVDQDNHGDPDHLDVVCVVYGADYDSETAPVFSNCANNRDDDSDGFQDQLDPDCEYPGHNRERDPFHDPADPTRPIVNACYDGIDNDGDGTEDADDPSCWNPAYGYRADGFVNDEARAWDNGCSDGTDEDRDGWKDGLDPDCVVGDVNKQDEVGFGSTQCNDGVDNDGDGLVDANDTVYCKTALGNFEGPSN
jgi:hypothetical protein